MSEKGGNLSFYRMAQSSYDKPYSDVTAKLIDDEVRVISDQQFKRAIDLLTEKREQLDKLAALLLEKEVLLKKDLVELLGKRPWDKEETPVDSAPIIVESESEISNETIADEII